MPYIAEVIKRRRKKWCRSEFTMFYSLLKYQWTDHNYAISMIIFTLLGRDKIKISICLWYRGGSKLFNVLSSSYMMLNNTILKIQLGNVKL